MIGVGRLNDLQILSYFCSFPLVQYMTTERVTLQEMVIQLKAI